MSNEDQHLRERDEVARDALIKRIKQAKLNAAEWRRRAQENNRQGLELTYDHRYLEALEYYRIAANQERQAREELRRHGH